MKIVTYNVMIGGVFEGDWKPTPCRLSDVIKVIRELDPDVLGLQETLSWQKRKGVERCAVSELRKMYKHEVIFDDDIDEGSFKTHGTGCALFSKKKPESQRIIIREKARAVEMTFGGVSISCVYLSHEDENKRLEQIKPVLDELSKSECNHRIVMGDFNAISPKDNITPGEINKLIRNDKTYKKYFKRIINKTSTEVEYEYEDRPLTETIDAVYGKEYEDAALKICERKNRSKEELRDKTSCCDRDSVAIRMDYFFVTKDLLPYIENCGLRRDDFVQKVSDHFPWELTLSDSLFK